MKVRVNIESYQEAVVDKMMMRVYSALMFQGLTSTVRFSEGGLFIEVDLIFHERNKIVDLLEEEFKKDGREDSPARSVASR